MAWASRTTRDSNPIGNPFRISGTGRHVGPGAYNSSTSSFGRAGPSYVPFASSSKRRGLGGSDGTGPVGPGQYNIRKDPGHSTKPSMETPFMSFQERFGSGGKAGAPGPGSYQTEDMAMMVAKKAAQRAQVRADAARAAAGPMAAGEEAPVTWMRMPTAPSIPNGAQSYGYEEGSDGALVQQPPPSKGYSGVSGDTAGPGAYNPDDHALAGRTNRKVDFSKAAYSRTNFAKMAGDGPDPGAYQPDLGGSDAHTDYWKPPARQSSTFASRTKRTGGIPSTGAAAEEPGPGAYGVHKLSAFEKKTVPTRNQFFGSTSRRFAGSGAGRFKSGPGPGSYSSGSSFSKPKTAPERVRYSPRRAGHAEKSGFTSTARRFGSKSGLGGGAGEAPSPGAYSLPTMASDIMKKRDVGRCGVFGSTTKRFFRPEETEVKGKPGPGEYEVKATLDPSRRAPKSSVFASTQKRFSKGFASATQDGPPPGAYDPKIPWDGAVFARRSDGTQGLIGSGGNRFGSGKHAAVPGPGAYEAPIEAKAGVGALMSAAPRFDVALPPRAPGPGQYRVDPPGGSMNRRTYNLTVATEEQRAERYGRVYTAM